jgi:signal peptidase I
MRKWKKKWDKFTEGWFGTLVYLFLGFVIAYGVNITLGLMLGTETPVVAVFSNSMVPTFYRGDMIIVIGRENFEVGDVIVFNANKSYPIIHRVYEKNNYITTKGDNNSGPDGWKLTNGDIYGKAVIKIPMLGWVKIKFVELTGIG